jgi:four helix bundle protein
MDNSDPVDFNNKYRLLTKEYCIRLCNSLNVEVNTEVGKVILRQVVRSGTSFAANFHAATRARSAREYYSKLCIVVEECDETLFWIDLLISGQLIQNNGLSSLREETFNFLRLFSSVRKNVKNKLNP